MNLAGGIWRQFKLILALSLPQGCSGRYFCTWGTTWIIVTIPQGNSWPSWSDMANIANYQTFKYGACTGFWQINTFSIHVRNWSHISFSVNQTLGKSGRWSNYATKTGNWHKTLIIRTTCVIMSMCFTKGNFTFWHKGIKHVPPISKVFLVYLCWNSTTSKRVFHIHTWYTKKEFLHMMLYLKKGFLVN